MNGIATLSAYGGQTITFNGTGSFSVKNYAAYLAGTGSLDAIGSLAGRSTMNVVSYFSADVGIPTVADSVCPPFDSFGSEIKDYAQATITLPAFTVEAYADAYIPPPQTGALITMPAFVSIGLGSVTYIGTGDASCAPFSAIGSEGSYSQADSAMPAFFSGAFEGYKNLIVEIDRASIDYSITASSVLLVVCNSVGNVVDSYSITREVLISIIDSALVQSDLSTFSTYNLYNIEALTVASRYDVAKGTDPNLDNTRMVWCINLGNEAAAQYEQYGFNNFIERNGQYYGVADDGIYELTGSDNAGLPVNALVEFGMSDYEIPQNKRITNVYLGIGSSGALYLKVNADNQEYTYQMRSSGATMENRRVDIGKGLQGNYWNWTLINNGEDFDLDTIEFHVIPLSRKIK